MERMTVEGNLQREERPKPVDVSNYVAKPVGKGSRMVLMPGEILQRHGASN